MSRDDDIAGCQPRSRVRTGDRGSALPVPVCTAFLEAGPIKRIGLIKLGLLTSDARRILSGLGIPEAALMVSLDIPVAALKRGAGGRNRLPPAASERIFGVARLVGRIQNIVEESGNPQSFNATAWMSRWFSEPLPALGGLRPLDLLDTMEGQALVSNTLAQIQGGVYT